MKKFFVIATVSMLLLSCGGATTPCDCAKALGEMNTAYKDAAGDDAKVEELNEKFEKLNKDCESIKAEMGDEKFNKEMSKCMESAQ